MPSIISFLRTDLTKKEKNETPFVIIDRLFRLPFRMISDKKERILCIVSSQGEISCSEKNFGC